MEAEKKIKGTITCKKIVEANYSDTYRRVEKELTSWPDWKKEAVQENFSYNFHSKKN